MAISASLGDITQDTGNAGSWNWSFDATDGPSQSQTVVVTAPDSKGGHSSVSIDLTVNNLAPDNVVIDPSVDELVFAVGDTKGFSGIFEDDSPVDTHTAEWTFKHVVGFDTITETRPGNVVQASGGGVVSDNFAFGQAGIYSARLTVTDDDGASTSSEQRMFVVYDPSEGFVTGGGWITSPTGALAEDPSLTGKANVGFQREVQRELDDARRTNGVSLQRP